MLKLRFFPSMLAIICYLILLRIFFQDEGPSDGWTLLGIPFYFYTYSGGKFQAGYRPHFGFHAVNFWLDVLTLIVMIIIFNLLYTPLGRLRKSFVK